MAQYATIAQARAEGATGTDAEVTAAIRLASARVDQHTRDVHDRRTLTHLRGVDGNGVVRLPYPAVAVTDVRVPGQPAGTPSITGYRLAGDTLYLGASVGGWDVLRNHDPLHYAIGGVGQASVTKVQVTADYGPAVTPADVAEATARIAAGLTPGAAGTVNAEGDADLGTPPGVPLLTEDDDLADPTVLALLAPFTRPRALVS